MSTRDNPLPAGSEARVCDNSVPGGIPRLGGRRVLVAEDVETNKVLLHAILERAGATVEAVSDGDALLERHTAEPADLIVMDLQMPGMGGIAAARRIRGLPCAAGRVPILAVTAYARGANQQLTREAGMDAYLSKPVVISEFYDLLQRLLPEPPSASEGRP